jgi:hypothetical protein
LLQLREFKARKTKEFFRVDPSDAEVVAIKEQLEEKRNLQASRTTPAAGQDST